MANELNLRSTATGETIYATIRAFAGTMWNGSTLEALTVANWGNYDIAMTETPASSYYYVATWPASLTTAGWYYVDVYRQAGASPDISDSLIASLLVYWDGTTASPQATDASASAVASVTAGVSLADDAITSAKFDETTAFPLKSADAGATTILRQTGQGPYWTGGMRVDGGLAVYDGIAINDGSGDTGDLTIQGQLYAGAVDVTGAVNIGEYVALGDDTDSLVLKGAITQRPDGMHPLTERYLLEQPETDMTPTELLRLILAVVAGETDVPDENTVAFKRADGETVAVTVAHDTEGKRTTITYGTLT